MWYNNRWRFLFTLRLQMEVYQMKKKGKLRRFASSWLGLILILAAIYGVVEGATLIVKSKLNVVDPVATVHCDVKHFLKLKTTINVDYDSNDSVDGVITGDFAFGLFKKVHDPLDFRDNDGKNIGGASDTYHLITQDDHTIVDYSNGVTTVMRGQIQLLGEKYLIYDAEGQYIAYLDVGVTDTFGGLYDPNGELWATYKAHFLFKDYDITIGTNAKLPRETIMLLFASYYSDHSADLIHSSSSHSRSK